MTEGWCGFPSLCSLHNILLHVVSKVYLQACSDYLVTSENTIVYPLENLKCVWVNDLFFVAELLCIYKHDMAHSFANTKDSASLATLMVKNIICLFVLVL